MLFSDLALSRRLESAEGHACVAFAEARRKLFPDCDTQWMEFGGAQVVFDGIDSPLTQTFGLGVFEELTPEVLDVVERFFSDRGTAAVHEVSPLAGVGALSLLCARQYRPVEISSVMFRSVEKPVDESESRVHARIIRSGEEALWSEVSAAGWTHEHPELKEFLLNMGAISAARADSPCFLAELDGRPGAAGALCIHEGVALFAGAATAPEMRRHGLQGALLRERMRYAHEHGCDLAMMVAEAGSNSQRNAERSGFRVAYTRTKWRLACSA